MRRSHQIYLALCIFIITTVAWAAAASPAGLRVYVGFDTETTRGTKEVSGPTAHGGTGAIPLLPGEKGVSWVFFGSSDRPDDWCSSGIGAAPAAPTAEVKARMKEQMLKSASTLWWAEYTLVSATPEKSVVSLDWERWKGGTKVGGDHRTVELKTGEAHTLDFANADLSGKGPVCARSVIVRLVAGIADEQAAAKP
jgi:hypothetical protein